MELNYWGSTTVEEATRNAATKDWAVHVRRGGEALVPRGQSAPVPRHYSQFLALQLKAHQIGLPTPVYGVPPVHHLS